MRHVLGFEHTATRQPQVAARIQLTRTEQQVQPISYLVILISSTILRYSPVKVMWSLEAYKAQQIQPRGPQQHLGAALGTLKVG